MIITFITILYFRWCQLWRTVRNWDVRLHMKLWSWYLQMTFIVIWAFGCALSFVGLLDPMKTKKISVKRKQYVLTVQYMAMFVYFFNKVETHNSQENFVNQDVTIIWSDVMYDKYLSSFGGGGGGVLTMTYCYLWFVISFPPLWSIIYWSMVPWTVNCSYVICC
jgi:hypothetical protein